MEHQKKLVFQHLDPAFDQLFPQLSGKILAIHRIPYSSQQKSIIMEEQIRFNKFMLLANKYPDSFVPYYLINVEPKTKKTNQNLTEIIGIEQGHELIKLEDIFQTILKVRNKKKPLNQVQIQIIDKQICFIWKLFVLCLNRIKKIFQSDYLMESFLANSYEFFLLVDTKNIKNWKVLIKLGQKRDKIDVFFFNQFIKYQQVKMSQFFNELMDKLGNKNLIKDGVKSIQDIKSGVVKQIQCEQVGAQIQMEEPTESKQIVESQLFSYILSIQNQIMQKIGYFSNTKSSIHIKPQYAIDVVNQVYKAHIRQVISYFTQLEKIMETKGNINTINNIIQWCLVQTQKNKVNGIKMMVPQMILREWELAQQKLLFSNKFKMFKYCQKNKFYNYAHFEYYITKMGDCRFRKQNVYFLSKNQKISLYCGDRMIKSAVRGKYCRHIQFYDLKNVYLVLKNSKIEQQGDDIDLIQSGQTSSTKSLRFSNDELDQQGKVLLKQGFNCLVCGEWIQIQDILYLDEINILTNFVIQHYIIPHESIMREEVEQQMQQQQEHDQAYRNWRVFVHMDHIKQQSYLEVKYNSNASSYLKLRNIYATLIDPLNNFSKKLKQYHIHQFPSTKNQEYSEFQQLEILLERAWLIDKKQQHTYYDDITISQQ